MKKVLLSAVILLAAVMVIVVLVPENNDGAKQSNYDEVKEYPFPKNDKPGEYLELYKELTYRAGKPTYGVGYKMKELNDALSQQSTMRKSSAPLDFVERGPANVPGRTRGLFVDPADATHQTWLAGTVGGGIWKTTNAGESWINMTPEFPNLAINALAHCESDPDVLYAGTGEGWLGSTGFIGGTGIFKSTDRGETWSLLESTNILEFEIVNRVWVHPDNPDVVLACTNNDPIYGTGFFSYIYKSVDGGETWDRVYSGSSFVQQIVHNPDNADELYATVRSIGVIKSTDGGATWSASSNGMSPSGRIEMAVSPVDPTRLYAAVEGNLRIQREDGGNGSDIYYSDDSGANWVLLREKVDEDVDFFNTQGWYDNTIMAHPFEKDIVYVGGVGTYKVELEENITSTERTFAGANEENTDFLALVNFNAGSYYGNKIAVGNAAEEDFTSIEIRFGPDQSQMAHRFTVPEGRGSGVPDAEFTYEDYVEVPFEAWDIDADPPRQLMVSFRDQQRDGVFNLLPNNTDDADAENNSREYLYISATDYDASTPDADMSQDGGHISNNMYFLWPFLAEGQTWDANNLPESTFRILWRSLDIRDYGMASVADVYGFIDGVNAFQQNTGETQVTGVHPDMHNLVPIIHDAANKEWQILNANDGGVYVSNVSTDPGTVQDDWTFAGNLMNTTQFYAADKMPGEDRYIGGSQDNGTWLTQADETSSETSEFQRALGGDGFGVAWHSKNPDLLLGSLYNLRISRSTNGGENWSAVSGISDERPFITKIENSHAAPDVVYTAGESGVWRSLSFGLNWRLIPIETSWVNETSSFFSVEISDATPDVVWAGNRMDEVGVPHVSTDNGFTFSPTTFYDEMPLGVMSGLASHPTDHKTAYALFSYAESPKILRTTDLGETWEDITGFDPGSTSTGFPDVSVLDLIVMPHDPNTLWAGTEIGIFESNDNGETWHILDADLPRVSVWDMNINEDQLVLGTHGRGIWTFTLPEAPVIKYPPVIEEITSTTEGVLDIRWSLEAGLDSVQLYVDGAWVETFVGVEAGEQTYAYDFDASVEDIIGVYAVGYNGVAPFSGTELKFIWEIEEEEVEVLEAAQYEGLRLYPNPTADFLTIESEEGISEVSLYDLSGSRLNAQFNNDELDLRSFKSGIYLVKIHNEKGQIQTIRIIKN